ncbi:hypothetical protein KB206_00275 [Microvirga sp. STS02]|uniref:JAB domain-containing protein n=1 Tax=Hymenobacter negativus TaxID=2795026 RepID=UPI0018DC6A7D|nr:MULTISPECIES: JAB domain-containing protein [Bacteria]MBH8567300.1 hypothetical protein [Hymenobacter negativus]MBR7207032.1 hypothetical protein [Microvirga sp. STS02]
MSPQQPQSPTPSPPSALRDTYDYIKSNAPDVGAELPDQYDEFERGMQDPENLKALHEVFKAKKWRGADLDPDQFAAELGISKKKAPSDVSGTGLPVGDVPFQAVTPERGAADIAIDPLAIPGVNAPAQEQIFPATFTGPIPAGAYQKREDAGTPAEGTSYLTPQSQAGQLNDTPAAPEQQDSFFSALGKGIANIPGDLVRVGGNTLDYLGDFNQRFLTPKSDVAPGYEDEVGVVTDDKPSDRMGAAIREQGDKMKFEIAANARKSVLDDPTNGAAWGNLLGQGVNSVVQVGAASALGGPAAGVAMGGALGISSTKDTAREAGLSEIEALYTATALAPIQGALEEMGMGFITKNKAVTSLLTKTIVGRALAEGGGKLSETALAKAVASVLPGVVKSAAKGGAGEAVTEFLQGETEGIAQLAADKLRGNDSAPAGQGRYGVTPFQALVKSPIEQGIGGFIVGAPASALHGASHRQPALTAEQVTQRRRAPEGTAPITTDRPTAKLLGKAVVVRDDAGMTQLGKIHNAVGTGDNRAIIVRDSAGKLSRHPQANVYTTSPTPTTSTPSPASTPRIDPGPTADPIPTTPRPQAADLSSVNYTELNSASAGGDSAVAGPTLGELVPDANPVQVMMGDEPVTAFRNAEGDIELHHADGQQVSTLDKGDQFDMPAANVLLSPAPKGASKSGPASAQPAPKINPLPADATLTIGSGEFAQTLPIEDVVRDKSGQITDVMVTGKNGSRLIDNSTPEGAAALAELNRRNFVAIDSDSQPPDNQERYSALTLPENPVGSNQPTAPAAPNSATPVSSSPGERLAAGSFTKDGTSYTRQAPLQERAVRGKQTTVHFANGVAQSATYALIEATDLQPSHTGGIQNLNHFIPESQPKNRSAAFDPASQKAIRDITDAPDVAQLSEAPTAYAGAPIVNERGELIQGNGRAEGIRQHYAQQDTAYRAGILNAAKQEGIDLAQAAKMKQPVLVRFAAVDDAKAQELGNYTAADTESGGQRRFDVKQAGDRLDPDSPAAKRQAALDKINARRGQQGSAPSVVSEPFTQAYELRPIEPASIRKTGHQAIAAAERARARAGGKGQLRPGDGDNNGGRGPVSNPSAAPGEVHRGKAEVIQSSISAELREKGYASFVGRVIRSIADIAEMAQVLRDPRLETFRYYFVTINPDGTKRIVGERTMSSRMPGSTPAFPSHKEINGRTPAEWLKDEMARVGATHFYAQHNHPSGHTEPSEADLQFTEFIRKQVPGFLGHLILNHGKYSVIHDNASDIQQASMPREAFTATGGMALSLSRFPGMNVVNNVPIHSRVVAEMDRFAKKGEGWPADPLTQPSKPGDLLGAALGSTDDVVALAKHIEQSKDYVAIIGRGADGRVHAVGRLPLATLLVARKGKGGRSRGEAAIRAFARETGSPHVILAGLPKPKGNQMVYLKSTDSRYVNADYASVSDLVYRNVLLDAVQVDGESLAEGLGEQWQARPWIRPVPAPRVWEKLANYNGIPADDLNDFRAVLSSYTEEGTVSRKEMTKRFLADVGDEHATGLDHEQLRSLIREAQSAAGLVPKAKPGKAQKARAHAARYDNLTREAFTADERLYTPKTKINNQATADRYIQEVGLENAMAVALDKPEGFPGAAHVEVQEAVAREYRRLSDAAQQSGDKAEAERLWDLSKDARAAKVAALTDAGQTLSQVQGFVADNPDSVLDAVVKEAAKQAKPKLAKAEQAGAQVAKIVTRTRRTAMDSALKSDAVKKAREAATANADAPTSSTTADEPKGYGQANKYFPKLTAAELKAKLRGMGFSTIVPPELVQFVGYHVEALARAGGKNSFAEVSKRVVRDLGAKVKPLLPAAYEQARTKYVKRGGADANFTEPADVAALVAPAAVKAGIKKLGTTLDRISREHAEGVNMKGKTLAERYAAEAGLDAKTADAYAKAVEAEFAKQVTAKKSTLAARILTFQTRVLLGKNAATAVDKLLDTLNLASDPNQAGDLLKAQLKLPNITKAQADEFVKLAEAVRKAPAGFQRAAKVQDLMAAMSKVEHVDWREAGLAMWFANTLSGPLTHITNVISNAHQAAAETLISVADTWANTGSILAAIGPLRGLARAQRSGWAEATRVLTTGYLGTSDERFDVAGRNYLENKQFTGIAKPLNGLKYVTRALAAEDNIFRNSLRGMRSWEVAIKDAYKEVRRDASLSGEKLTSADLYQRATATALGKLYGLPDLLAAANSQADAENVPAADRKRRIGELVNQAVQERVKSWEKQAEAEGLTGIDKSFRVGELQQMAQPADLAADADQFSRENTFNDGMPGTAGAVAGLIAKAGDIPVVGMKVFRLIAPFSRIAASVLDRHLDFTPVGLYRAAVGSHGPREFNGGQHLRALTPEQRSKAATRAIVGTVSGLVIYGLGKAGYVIITGGYAGNKDKDEQRPERSIIFPNGLSMSYKDWPIELQLATIGDLMDYDRRQAKKGEAPSDGKRVAVALGLLAQYSASVGPSNGLDEFTAGLLKMSRQPDQSLSYLAKFATGTAKNMIPYAALDQQALRGLNILRGENQKENTADNALDAAYNSLVVDVPYYRDSMEDAIGPLGEPMKLSSARLWGWRPEERTAEDQRNLDWLVNYNLLPARKRISDDDLAYFNTGLQKLMPPTDAEFKQFQIARGHAFRDLLRVANRKPSEAPGIDAGYKAYLLAHPEANKSLPELDPNAARKKVLAMQKQAVRVGKATVWGTFR